MSIRFHINPETGTVSRCTAQKKCRFGGESGQDNHYNSTAEARKGYEQMMKKDTVPNSSSQSKTADTPLDNSDIPPLESLKPHNIHALISIASAHNARTLRKYRTLLQYCDLEAAKRMKANGDRSNEVAAAIDLAKIRAVVENREMHIARTAEKLKNKNLPPATKRRYQEEHTRLRGMLTSEKAKLKKNEQNVAQLVASLDKNITEHGLAVSRLQSYQVAAVNGAIPPARLARPLEQLPADSKKHLEGDYIRRSEEMLNALNSQKDEGIRHAAKLSGNEYHAANAEAYISHSKKIDRLESRMLAIRDALDAERKKGGANSAESQQLANEHTALLSSRDHAIGVKKVYAKRLEMFRSEIRDDLAYYKRANEEIHESVEAV